MHEYNKLVKHNQIKKKLEASNCDRKPIITLFIFGVIVVSIPSIFLHSEVIKSEGQVIIHWYAN